MKPVLRSSIIAVYCGSVGDVCMVDGIQRPDWKKVEKVIADIQWVLAPDETVQCIAIFEMPFYNAATLS